jgi:uncharacterized membrane protein YfcA
MTMLEFSVLVGLVSSLAGFVGSLTGLGGGVVLTPVLTLLLGVDLRYAIGATLVSVIATSSGAAAAYVKEGYSNIRVGMMLEIATTLGALVSAVLASRVPAAAVAIVFGVVLLGSAYLGHHPPVAAKLDSAPDRLATLFKMDGSYPSPQGPRAYHVSRLPAGFGLMFVAGVLSGLLGIGSGALKVLAMDRVMRLPFKVSTTTSNFMIGVTAAASAGVYLARGYIDPVLAMPVMLGVLGGALLGAQVLVGVRTPALRVLFSLIVAALGLEMIVHGLRGQLS